MTWKIKSVPYCSKINVTVFSVVFYGAPFVLELIQASFKSFSLQCCIFLLETVDYLP